MSARLTTEIWVSAYLRRCQVEGAMAVVARKGAPEAGAVAVKVHWLGAGATALTQVRLGDGRAGWTWLVGPAPEEERVVDQKLERQAKFDPDLWVIEVEDREGRPFLDDPIA